MGWVEGYSRDRWKHTRVGATFASTGFLRTHANRDTSEHPRAQPPGYEVERKETKKKNKDVRDVERISHEHVRSSKRQHAGRHGYPTVRNHKPTMRKGPGATRACTMAGQSTRRAPGHQERERQGEPAYAWSRKKGFGRERNRKDDPGQQLPKDVNGKRKAGTCRTIPRGPFRSAPPSEDARRCESDSREEERGSRTVDRKTRPGRHETIPSLEEARSQEQDDRTNENSELGGG